jgi:hypothetical protein
VNGAAVEMTYRALGDESVLEVGVGWMEDSLVRETGEHRWNSSRRVERRTGRREEREETRQGDQAQKAKNCQKDGKRV